MNYKDYGKNVCHYLAIKRANLTCLLHVNIYEKHYIILSSVLLNFYGRKLHFKRRYPFLNVIRAILIIVILKNVSSNPLWSKSNICDAILFQIDWQTGLG